MFEKQETYNSIVIKECFLFKPTFCALFILSSPPEYPLNPRSPPPSNPKEINRK